MSSWRDDPKVAESQRHVVVSELESLRKARAFVQFVRAMDLIYYHTDQNIKTFYDLGCGCGHYGVVVERFYSRIKYSGFDFSPHMIEVAKRLCPTGEFTCSDLMEVDISGADVVLLSQSIEYVDNPFNALRVLDNAQGWIILHKIRTTTTGSHKIGEKTYAGHTENCFLWNFGELADALARRCVSIVGLPIEWEKDIYTLVCRV